MLGAVGGGYAGYKAGGWLSEKAGFEKGGMADNITSYGGAALGAIGGGLLGNKVGGMFGNGAKEGTPVYVTNISDIDTGGGLTDLIPGKGISKMIPSIARLAGGASSAMTGGLGITGMLGSSMGGIGAAGAGAMASSAALVAAAGYGGYKLGGWLNDTLLTDDKGQSRLFGGTDYGSKEENAAYEAAMAKAKARQAENAAKGPNAKSPAMAVGKVSPQSGNNQSSANSMKIKAERTVNDIKNNSQGLAYVSESTTLRNSETKSDVANIKNIGKATKEAIGGINITAPQTSQQVGPTIIITGDMDSYATRLAKSY
jgi:hypothetical protein